MRFTKSTLLATLLTIPVMGFAMNLKYPPQTIECTESPAHSHLVVCDNDPSLVRIERGVPAVAPGTYVFEKGVGEVGKVKNPGGMDFFDAYVDYWYKPVSGQGKRLFATTPYENEAPAIHNGNWQPMAAGKRYQCHGTANDCPYTLAPY